MRIGIASRDWSSWMVDGQPTLGGSGYYRCGLVARALESLGHDVVLGTLTASDSAAQLGVRTWDEVMHWNFDVVLLQRWMFEDLPDRIGRARANGQVVLNDVDDWWEGLDPANRAWRVTSAEFNSLENREHYRRVLAASSAIVCSTPFLAERYLRLAPTVVIRNCLDLDRWRRQEPREGPPVLGWVGALPWRSGGDVEALAGFLGPFLERHDLRFHHAGALEQGWAFAHATGIPPWRLTQSPMVPITEHERQFEGLDVAVVPLADKPFNEAKSALKGIQAAAAGVPYVASASPEYAWLSDTYNMGRVAKRTKHWQNHLEALMDPGVRQMDSVYNGAMTLGFGMPRLARSWEVLLRQVCPGR